MSHTGLHHLGIQHVIESSVLVSWLEKWSSSSGVDKEEAEQTIRALFVDASVKVIFIPVFGMEEEKKRELRRNVKEWNRGDTRPKLMATAPGADVSGDRVWSDRKEAEEGGKI